MKKVQLIVGARPNFMKMAPLYKELERSDKFEVSLVHTGQHYDERMSKQFFTELLLPEPHIYLGVGSGTHGYQTAKIIEKYEAAIINDRPDLVLVAGDVNSTIACALVAKKLNIMVGHIEAGLRSFDMRMPEEINRILTDSISDLLFTPSLDGNVNLEKSGVDRNKIFFVGNIMIDSLVNFMDKANNSSICKDLGLKKNHFCLVTLHRPSNVDDKHNLELILNALKTISETIDVVFPMHPRTKKNIEKLGLSELIESISNMHVIPPASYLDFMKLQMDAKFIVTDSGGVQEESTFFNIPCLTLRENTERPITITEGTNKLVGLDYDKIVYEFNQVINNESIQATKPKYWDGKTSERIVKILEDLMFV